VVLINGVNRLSFQPSLFAVISDRMKLIINGESGENATIGM
jgi:hypothetical protein